MLHGNPLHNRIQHNKLNLPWLGRQQESNVLHSHSLRSEHRSRLCIHGCVASGACRCSFGDDVVPGCQRGGLDHRCTKGKSGNQAEKRRFQAQKRRHGKPPTNRDSNRGSGRAHPGCFHCHHDNRQPQRPKRCRCRGNRREKSCHSSSSCHRPCSQRYRHWEPRT